MKIEILSIEKPTNLKIIDAVLYLSWLPGAVCLLFGHLFPSITRTVEFSLLVTFSVVFPIAAIMFYTIAEIMFYSDQINQRSYKFKIDNEIRIVKARYPISEESFIQLVQAEQKAKAFVDVGKVLTYEPTQPQPVELK